MTGVARRLALGWLAMLVLAAFGVVGAERARAAQYTVSACGAAAGFQNNLLTASVSDGRMSAYTACPNDGSGHFVGVAAIAGVSQGSVPVFANSIQSFLAPAGTTIRHLHVKAEGRAWNGDWASLLQASNDRFGSSFWNLSGCSGNAGSANGCVSALVNLDQNYDLNGATGVRALVSCGSFSGCTTVSTGSWPFTRAYYFLHEFDVALEDDSSPVVGSPGGALASQQWLHGSHTLTFDARDNSGIRRTRFWVDDLGTINDDVRDCNYTYAVPCSNVPNGEYSLDTSRLTDGIHHIAADGLDATDTNVGSVAQTIFVDNHAPAEPGAPFVVEGEGWHTTNDFTVRWTNPPSAAPIERASYEICAGGGGGPCTTGTQASRGVDHLSNLQVAGPGDYTVRVWLADGAGNVSDAKSAPLHLKFDNVPPAQAAPQHRNGWVDKSHAAHVDQEIDLGGNPPVSGIAGYALSTDGSAPGETVTVPANGDNGYVGHADLVDLPEGTTTVRARAISGAGISSHEVGSTDIHVDLTPPALAVEGAPGQNRWSREPAKLSLVAVDPGQLSGMASGPSDRDVESGGYIEFAVDGGDKKRVRGPERDLDPDGLLGHVAAASAEVPVSADGPHTVTYQAYDVAGNATSEKSVSFKIDQTPPELAVFEAQQASDPRLITVAASDRTSGLADGGTIQMRRIAPSQGSWITLRASRQDDRYYAHVDNSTLPEGDYEFRATIPDQAGNDATATSDRNGRAEIIHITPIQIGPFLTVQLDTAPPAQAGPDAQDVKATVDTRIDARAVQRTYVGKKCKGRPGKKRKGHARRTKCPPRRIVESLVHDLRVRFGKPASIKGTLTTAAGAPIAGAEVTVLARPAMAGSSYLAEASVRTDGAGAFAYRVPAGPGRTLDFHFRGDDTYRHADDQVNLRVPASATIRASRHAIRNGNRAQFSGKLLGPPYPAKGKVLDLQAYYRNRWRTFATPRAGRTGMWRYSYRFEATRGTVAYKFRVRVRATSDYPYELGYSKATIVRVTGH